MGTSVGGNLGQVNSQVNTSLSFGKTECHSHITQAHFFPWAPIVKLLGSFLQRTLGGKETSLKLILVSWYIYSGKFVSFNIYILHCLVSAVCCCGPVGFGFQVEPLSKAGPPRNSVHLSLKEAPPACHPTGVLCNSVN